MILSTSTSIVVAARNITRYKELLYECNIGDVLEVKLEHLSINSKATILVRCDYCNNSKNIMYSVYTTNISSGGKFACSKKCGFVKAKQSNLIKYGVENVFQSNIIKDKIKETCTDKYGVENPSQSNIIKEKKKETTQQNYGVEHFSKTDKYKDKIKETCIDRYGVEYIFQSNKIKDKIKETCIDRYGVENPSQSKFIKEKKKETLLKNYGVEHFSKTDEFKDKVRETSLYRYGVNSYTQTSEYIEKTKQTNLYKYGAEYYSKTEIYHKDTFIGKNENYINYIDNSISLFNCDKGHTFEINSDNYHGRSKNNLSLCTICNPISDSRSIKEKDLFEFIESIYDDKIIQSYRDGLEIDIYLPELKLGFEFNGLYWHSEKFKEKNYHLDKTNYFKYKGIRIIHIWEDDWTSKEDIIKSQISNLLGKSHKIFARKCVIKEIDTKITRKFLDANHIQGFVSSKIKLGLYYTVTQSNGVTNEELVSIMTFDSFEGRKKMEEGGYNLNRFCNKINTNVVGGASKLLSYFIKEYSVSRIISYADKDWSIGGLYYILGFVSVGGNGPDYKYIVDNKRVHKSRYKKSRLKTELTESQATKELGINRIYDCGKIKFEYNERDKQ